MRFSFSLLTTLLLSTAAFGCSSGGCPTPEGASPFEIGTGDTCFERVSAGQTLPVNAGPQGGFHLWTAFGCADCGEKATVQFGAQDPKTKEFLLGFATKVVVDLQGGDWKQRAGLTAVLPGDAWDQTANKLPTGSHVVLSLSVLGDGGKALHSSEVEVVLGPEVSSSCSDEDTCGETGLAPCCAAGNAL